MDKLTIAAVQMQMRLHASLDDYRDDLRRFLRAADTKRARLILFPEMAGLMLAPLLLGDRRSNLLRRAEVGRRRSAGAWDKVSGKAAGWLAQALKADLGQATAGLLDVEPQRLWEVYVDVFGGLARSQGVTIVAPSAYLPDPAAGDSGEPVLRNLSAIFGPNGEMLGTQAKVLGANDDEVRVERGVGWRVIATEVGRVGLLLGNDVLYPEVGRVLAYQNAEILLLQGASASAAGYHKLRAAILARMQDNQLYAAASFVVGANPLRTQSEPFLGRSAILVPQELTPKYNGVLVEMGSAQSEGVITAEWDYTALKHLWDTSEAPLRRALAPEEAAPVLAALYTQLKALPQAHAMELLSAPIEVATAEIPVDAEPPAAAADAGGDADGGDANGGDGGEGGEGGEGGSDVVRELDDLPLLGSVRSHWPLQPVDPESGVEEIVEDVVARAVPTDVEWTTPRSYTDAESDATIRRDDETDEMDAVENEPAVVAGEGAAPAEPESAPEPQAPAAERDDLEVAQEPGVDEPPAPPGAEDVNPSPAAAAPAAIDDAEPEEDA